ncbi:MAG: 50S ribosomal protein L6, partial [Sphaerochaetaceae bacterium]|nr:50S ribosomal protein L6 [Sphaerochaetaceae bacterium]
MSRIGKLPVEVPGGVNVSVTDTTITAEGPKGRLVQDYRNEVQIVVDGNQVVVTRKNDSKPA